jgi:hypothetical protein
LQDSGTCYHAIVQIGEWKTAKTDAENWEKV